jgi:hypothetical protein
VPAITIASSSKFGEGRLISPRLPLPLAGPRFLPSVCQRKTTTKESSMSNIYVEQESDGTYVATQTGRTVATGDAQWQTIDRARRASPDDPVLAERVRDTSVGGRDKWRRAYGGNSDSCCAVESAHVSHLGKREVNCVHTSQHGTSRCWGFRYRTLRAIAEAFRRARFPETRQLASGASKANRTTKNRDRIPTRLN